MNIKERGQGVEKIKIGDIMDNDFAHYIIITGIVRWEKENKREVPITPSEPFEVQLTVNGVELPFLGIMRSVGDQLEEMVRERAESLIRGKLFDVEKRISQIHDLLGDIVGGKFEDPIKE